MKKTYAIILFATLILFFVGWKNAGEEWMLERHNGYKLWYTSVDNSNTKEYDRFIVNGMKMVTDFFQSSYPKEFSVFIHPDRQSLDSAWKKDWNTPAFTSECWMVASGTATKLDMISPKFWDKQSCEHIYSDTTSTQQLITHELVHVYQGQINVSPDFSNTEGIDWFVEGLATFASGQCNRPRIMEVKTAIRENKIPTQLDEFWTGKIRYGLCGSVAMYIDHAYGRNKLKELLPLNKKSDLLAILKTTEPALLAAWKKYMTHLEVFNL